MWLLYARNGDERDRPRRDPSGRPDRGTDTAWARGESLPVYRLSQYRKGHSGSLASHARQVGPDGRRVNDLAGDAGVQQQ